MTAPTAPPQTPPVAPETRPPVQPSYWLWVLCLLGVDYFSTLAYQPSISFQVAGRLAPLATAVVVLITLGCALPVYFYVAGRSAHGAGSIALLEQVVGGWRGKTLVLGLLGFAATDFVMIKTLSLADAAEHVLHNSYFEQGHTLQAVALWAKDTSRQYLGERFTNFFNEQLVVTILLGIVGFVFWFVLRKGFNRNVMAVAVPIVAAYLLLNAVVLGFGLAELAQHPERLQQWFTQVQQGDWHLAEFGNGQHGWLMVGLLCLLFLPQLALGLSGFEMSLIVMPQVRGDPGDSKDHPHGRIRNTRKVLVVAALIMAVYLLGSVLVTTTLIPPEAFRIKGPADNRALAYLAHGGPLAPGPDGSAGTLGRLFGPAFGSLYDVVTVALLCLAGTSVMTALAVLLPQFLLRFGMELKWAHKWGLLLGLFALVNLAVTLYFQASVHDQRGAYATGVMVLMSSAALVSFLSVREHNCAHGRRKGARFGLAVVVFLAITIGVLLESPSGLLIAFGFIVTILSSSVVARAVRCDELRTTGFDFANEESKFLWDSLCLADFPVLVPHRPGRHERELKEKTIRADHQLDPEADVVFLEVEVDDPSNFYQRLLVEVFREDKRFVIKLTRCVSVSHAIAAVALEMSRLSKPPGVHFGWSEMDLLAASWSYLAFGEGNVPWKVRELIREAEPDPAKRPRVIIG
jgi:hypothetical protein